MLKLLLLVVSVFCHVNGLPKEKLSVELTDPSGTIQSLGYPTTYDKDSAETWKLRVEGAEYYILDFDDVDFDKSGCYDYITLYDDSNYITPATFICDKPSDSIKMDAAEMSIVFTVATTVAPANRGRGFSLRYQAYGQDITSTEATTETVTSTVSSSSSSTTTVSTTTVRTTTVFEGYFPPGNQDDSQCGAPSVTPVITGYDYAVKGSSAWYSRMLGSSRIVGGEEATPHSWPWQASIQGSYGSAYCGGTLVQAQWVVTAAHCAEIVFIGTYGSDQVLLGAHDKSANEPTAQLIDIVEKFAHPQYDNPSRSHDVALLKLKTPAILNDFVSLACEAHSGWSFPAGMNCVVTGWGVTREGGNIGTPILNQAVVPLMSDPDCYDLYQEANLDTTPDMQCAGGQGKTACNGDSGGPLNCYVNGRWYHMGIVSFGEANCDTDIASVYAKVAELRDFIDITIQDHS